MRCLLAALLATLAASATAAPMAVSVESVSETRESDGGELRLWLRVEGDGLDGALEYEKLRVTTARDDLGNDLLPPAAAPGAGRLKTAGGAVLFPVLLRPAPRAARSLAEVSGSAAIRTFRRQMVLITGVRALTGKAAEDPLFKAHGIEAFVTDPAQSLPGVPDAAEADRLRARAVSIRFSGQPQKVLGIELLDAAGDPVPSRSSSFGGGRSVLFTATADRELPADVRVRVAIPTSPEETEIPFTLKGIPLP